MAKGRQKVDENGMTHKQELYCRHFVEFGNKSEAYRHAYDCSNMKEETVWNDAYKLSKKPQVATRIKELKEELFESLNVNAYTIARDFLNIKERCMQKEPVTDIEGNETGEWKFDANNAIKANVELCKMAGGYEKNNSQFVQSVIIRFPDEK